MPVRITQVTPVIEAIIPIAVSFKYTDTPNITRLQNSIQNISHFFQPENSF